MINSFVGLGLGSDFNMELVIALEMSRLQMIEDRMKQAQAHQTNMVITPDPSSSVSNNSSSEATDDQLRLAIQLSLQESNNINKRKRESVPVSSQSYQKTSADLTVDYFLKSLANHKIDFRNLEIDNRFSSTGDAIWTRNERDCFFKPLNGKEDGRFQISDIHEKGFAFADSDDYDESDVTLKRSHSTGDLCVKRSGRGTRIRMHGSEEPRYHLDSDHSSQHDDKPEDIGKKNLYIPSSTRTKQFLLLHQPYPEEEIYYGQSSIEDTTTSDSVDTAGIIESITDDDLGGLYENVKKRSTDVPKPEEKKHNPLATLKAKICSAHLPKTSYLSRIAVNRSIGLLSDSKNQNERRNSDHAVHFKENSSKSDKGSPKSLKQKSKHKEPIFYKSTSFLFDSPHKNYNKQCTSGRSNLRIKICKNSPEPKHALETDSSNEYESETGIPKSPTLFISGVSISRTPEPNKTPTAMSMSISSQNGRQSRSSSLSVPATVSSTLNISSTSINNLTDNQAIITTSSSTTTTTATSKLQTTPNTSPSRTNNKENGKSKSASEPEREREMFRFPKSSTDGALSSVLHVQESNLSSDDFHEALFLLERSPKIRDSKRRKKSKKKDKECKEEASSAL